MTTAQQPGWYDDPDDPNAQRYWDGQDWTPHRQRKPISGPTQSPVMPTQPPPPPPVMPMQPPAVALGAQQQNLPNSHLVWAVFSLFCCFPFGIVAIINATKVSNMWALGQYDAARDAAGSARKFAMWGTIAGAVWIGGLLFFGVVLPMILLVIGTSTSQ